MDDGVLEVVLDWPQARNSLGPDDADTLFNRLQPAWSDECRCVVVRAEGDSFCAGGNLKAVWQLVQEGTDALQSKVYGSFQRLARGLREAPVPVLAAVNGPAIGLGFDLALACDMRFFGARSWVAQGWASFGLIPATGGLHYLRAIGGRDLAWRLLGAPNERWSPDELAAAGLGTAVPDADVAARDTAHRLAELPREVLVACKELLGTTDFAAHLERAAAHQVRFFQSEFFAAHVRARFGVA
jgi:enoyl-CoA hydratase/carnithine racemase